jgi:hypothetical protein
LTGKAIVVNWFPIVGPRIRGGLRAASAYRVGVPV